MTITTAEVADMLGVTPSRVRQLVMEGDLEPTVRGAKPLTFREVDVVEYELETRRNREQIARLAEQWRDDGQPARQVC